MEHRRRPEGRQRSHRPCTRRARLLGRRAPAAGGRRAIRRRLGHPHPARSGTVHHPARGRLTQRHRGQGDARQTLTQKVLRGYCEITITAVLVIVSVLLVMNGTANGKAYEVLTLTRSE